VPSDRITLECRNKGGEDRRGIPDMRAVSSRRRVVGNTKGITVSESLDVSLSRRCFRERDRMCESCGGAGGRNGVVMNSRKSLFLPPSLPLSLSLCLSFFVSLSSSVSLQVNIRPGITRPRPYICSLSNTPNSRVASEIGNKRKPNSVISDNAGRRTARDSLAVSRGFRAVEVNCVSR